MQILSTFNVCSPSLLIELDFLESVSINEINYCDTFGCLVGSGIAIVILTYSYIFV